MKEQKRYTERETDPMRVKRGERVKYRATTQS